MTLNDLKSEFGQAYVRAVAHAAGYFVQEAHRIYDGDGVDLTLFVRSTQGPVRSPRLDIQLKATSTVMDKDPFPLDLDLKTFDELRSEALQVPRILVVVSVPDNIDSWTDATEDELVLRRCGYWRSFRGEGPTVNKTTVRVHLDRDQYFHVGQVQALMERIRNGGLP